MKIIRLSIAALLFGLVCFASLGCSADTTQSGAAPKNAASGAEGAKQSLKPSDNKQSTTQ